MECVSTERRIRRQLLLYILQLQRVIGKRNEIIIVFFFYRRYTRGWTK